MRAFVQASEAAAAAELEQQRRAARAHKARELAASSMQVSRRDPDLGFLLAAEAFEALDVRQARAALAGCLTQSPGLEWIFHKHQYHVGSVDFSPDGRLLATSDNLSGALVPEDAALHHRLWVWDVDRGRAEANLLDSHGFGGSAWGRGGFLVVNRGDLECAYRYDELHGKLRQKRSHGSTVGRRQRAAASPSGNLVAMTAGDGLLLTRYTDGSSQHFATGTRCDDVAWLDDDTLLTIEDRGLRCRRLDRWTEVAQLVPEGCGLSAVDARGGTWVAVGHRADSFLLVGTQTTYESLDLVAGPAFPRDVALEAGRRRAWVAGGGGFVHRASLVALDLQRRAVVTTLLEGFDLPVLSVAVDAAGRRVAAGREDGRVFVWRLDEPGGLVSLNETASVAAQRAVDSALCTSTDGRVTATRGDGGWLTVVRDGHNVAVGEVSADESFAVAVSQAYLARVVQRGLGIEIEVRHLNQPDETRSASLRYGFPGPLRFLPDGHTLLFGDNTTLRVWDLRAAERPSSLLGHTNPIRHIAADPVRPRFATSSCKYHRPDWDEVLLWERGEAKVLARFDVPQNLLTLDFDEAGDELVGAAADGRAVRIDVDLDSWVRAARNAAGRQLTEAERASFRSRSPEQDGAV